MSIENPITDKKNESTQKPFGILRSIQTVISWSIIIASLLTLWTPANLFSNQLLENMLNRVQTTTQTTGDLAASQESLYRIGIVIGHWRKDTGEVCSDWITEEALNLRIATLVRQNLQKEGFKNIDLLQENDTRLYQYNALAVISIHSDSCAYLGDDASGFKVIPGILTTNTDLTNRFAACITDRYQKITGLNFINQSNTQESSQYPVFSMINSATPALMIKVGYMNLDREKLKDTNLIAQGISAGIICFLRNESINNSMIITSPTP